MAFPIGESKEPFTFSSYAFGTRFLDSTVIFFGNSGQKIKKGSIPGSSLDDEWQGSAHFFQGSPSRCADFKFFSNKDMANLSGLTAAEVGFLVVKPFKKLPDPCPWYTWGPNWECSLKKSVQVIKALLVLILDLQ